MVYRVDRNNFYEKEKKATIFTPAYVSDFLYKTLSGLIDKKSGVIFDPCVGWGSLLRPWQANGYEVMGLDIEDQGFPNTIQKNYLEMKPEEIGKKVSLVLVNPPFNIDVKTKEYIKAHYAARPLLPEVWLAKTISLLGRDVPMAMFTPYGFRLNQTAVSKRWKHFIDGDYPEITSIISLPKDVFDGILFHSEILLFNMPSLKGHYFVG